MQTSSISRSDATMQVTHGLNRNAAFSAILNGVIENAEGYTWVLDNSLQYIVCNLHLRNKIKELTGNEVLPGNEVIDFISLLDATQPVSWDNIYQSAFTGMAHRFTHAITVQQKNCFP